MIYNQLTHSHKIYLPATHSHFSPFSLLSLSFCYNYWTTAPKLYDGFSQKEHIYGKIQANLTAQFKEFTPLMKYYSFYSIFNITITIITNFTRTRNEQTQTNLCYKRISTTKRNKLKQSCHFTIIVQSLCFVIFIINDWRKEELKGKNFDVMWQRFWEKSKSVFSSSSVLHINSVLIS